MLCHLVTLLAILFYYFIFIYCRILSAVKYTCVRLILLKICIKLLLVLSTGVLSPIPLVANDSKFSVI